MLPEEIIIKPIITEKSNDGVQSGKYTFKVNKKATKVDIRRAVEKLFDVKVLNVNTMTVKGKQKRVGRYVGKTSDWKKAIVTIDSNKTKDAKALLSNFDIKRNALIVVKELSDNLILATRNLDNILLLEASEINVLDIVSADLMIVEEAAIKEIEEALK